MRKGAKGRHQGRILNIDNGGYKPRINDLVFAAVRSYPPWPAIVKDREHDDAFKFRVKLKSDPQYHFIQFYGTYEIAAIHQHNLYPFDRFKEKFQNPKKKTKAFVKAMEEVESDDPYFLLREDDESKDEEDGNEADEEQSDEVAEDTQPSKRTGSKLTKPSSTMSKIPVKVRFANNDAPSSINSTFEPVPFWGRQTRSITIDQPTPTDREKGDDEQDESPVSRDEPVEGGGESSQDASPGETIVVKRGERKRGQIAAEDVAASVSSQSMLNRKVITVRFLEPVKIELLDD